MAAEIWVEPAAESRKVEGANRTALLIPRPPELTGRGAWSQLKSPNYYNYIFNLYCYNYIFNWQFQKNYG